MDESSELDVIWTPKAIAGSVKIRGYLAYKFTPKEIANFFRLLSAFEQKIILFPELYPGSVKNKQIRRAVLSKQLSVFYIRKKNMIRILAVLDNRMDDSKWP